MKISSKEIEHISLQKNFSEKHNLHKSLAKVFLLAQIFGYLPVQGILGPNYRSLRFKWKSPKVFYTIFTILGGLFVSVMQLHKIITRRMDLLEADKLFFNCSGTLSAYFFLKFAIKWPQLMSNWGAVETSMVSYGWPSELDRKIKILTYGFMLMAFIEHILMQIDHLIWAFNCKNSTGEALVYFIGDMTNSHIFSVIPFNSFFGFILQIINLQLTFSWTFIDLFVMVLSTALAARLKQITARIQSVADAKIETEIIWKNLREDYNRICKLCRKVDEEISDIVLTTFASDLFFILIQLFMSLRNMRSDLERVYFYFSFGLLILKTVCLCLFGAKVNDESKKPIIILNSVPSSVYNLEIQRFIQQIGTTEVAITGKNFFSITRGLILSIAGAIVTYELVLIQFNDNLLSYSPDKTGTCQAYD